jgi:hypothetical protein
MHHIYHPSTTKIYQVHKFLSTEQEVLEQTLFSFRTYDL